MFFSKPKRLERLKHEELMVSNLVKKVEEDAQAQKESPKGKGKEKKSVALDAKAAEAEVVSLANAGHSPSQIGLILRDQHEVTNFTELTDKTIQSVLEEHKLLGDIPEDLLNLIRKSVVLQKHMEKNNKDYSAKRGYQLTVSKIRRLGKYYIKKGKLPSTWRYSPEQAALLVK